MRKLGFYYEFGTHTTHLRGPTGRKQTSWLLTNVVDLSVGVMTQDKPRQVSEWNLNP